MFNRSKKKRADEAAEQDKLQKEKELFDEKLKHHNEIDEKYKLIEERRLKIKEEFKWLEEMNKKIARTTKK